MYAHQDPGFKRLPDRVNPDRFTTTYYSLIDDDGCRSDRFVRSVLPIGKWLKGAEIEQLWFDTFGEHVDADLFRSWDAESTHAGYFPYDGPTVLTQDEQDCLENSMGKIVDFTIDDCYVAIECFGWRPGGLHKEGRWPSRDAIEAAYWYGEVHIGCGSFVLCALMMYATKPDGSIADDDYGYASDVMDPLYDQIGFHDRWQMPVVYCEQSIRLDLLTQKINARLSLSNTQKQAGK